MKIAVNKINLKANTQSRVEINQNIIEDFVEDIKKGDKFPPIILFRDNTNQLFVGDGWHRIFAFKKAKFKDIEADIKKGSKRDAILFGAGANATHGLRRTNADKKKSVMTLLNDPEWVQWSDNEIAKKCGVDHKTVGKFRKEMTWEIPKSNIRKGADGRTINTANIGSFRKKTPEKEDTNIKSELSKDFTPDSQQPNITENNDKTIKFKLFRWRISIERIKK